MLKAERRVDDEGSIESFFFFCLWDHSFRDCGDPSRTVFKDGSIANGHSSAICTAIIQEHCTLRA